MCDDCNFNEKVNIRIEQEPYYSEPIEVEEEIIYKLPEKMGEMKKSSSQYEEIEIKGDIWIESACNIAVESVRNSGGPFGAIILQIDKKTNRVIRYWKNHNQVTVTNDPTAHAEVMAIRSACKSLGVFNLGLIKMGESKLPQIDEESYCIIYSSTEPCPMCYSAICWAGIPVLLFGATRYDASADGVGFSDEEIYSELEKPYLERKIKVYRCCGENLLEPFEEWKKAEKIMY